MKFVIASDLHGAAPAVRKLVERIEAESPDHVLLLGDLLYHGPRNDLPEGYAPKEVLAMLNAMASRIIAVRGNCDAEVDQMVLDFPCMADCAQVFADGHLLHLTHGHLPGNNPDNAPTSISKDGSASYAVFEDEMFTLKTMEGETLKEGSWGQQ